MKLTKTTTWQGSTDGKIVQIVRFEEEDIFTWTVSKEVGVSWGLAEFRKRLKGGRDNTLESAKSSIQKAIKDLSNE